MERLYLRKTPSKSVDEVGEEIKQATHYWPHTLSEIVKDILHMEQYDQDWDQLSELTRELRATADVLEKYVAQPDRRLDE